jgi:hypothetical protein
MVTRHSKTGKRQLMRLLFYSEDTDRQYLKEINILQKCKAVAIAKERKKELPKRSDIFLCIVSLFQFFYMIKKFFIISPTHEVVTQHFKCSFGGLAPSPERY